MVESPEREIPEVVLALGSSRRFARSLDGRQQQRDKHADNGHDNQQLDQRERTLPCRIEIASGSAASRRGRRTHYHDILQRTVERPLPSLADELRALTTDTAMKQVGSSDQEEAD